LFAITNSSQARKKKLIFPDNITGCSEVNECMESSHIIFLKDLPLCYRIERQ